MTFTASSTGASGVVVYSVVLVPLMRRISLTSMALSFGPRGRAASIPSCGDYSGRPGVRNDSLAPPLP